MKVSKNKASLCMNTQTILYSSLLDVNAAPSNPSNKMASERISFQFADAVRKWPLTRSFGSIETLGYDRILVIINR